MMDIFLPDLGLVIFGNSIQCWLYATFTLLLLYILTRLLKYILVRKVKGPTQVTAAGWDDLLAELIERIHPAFLLIASIYIGTLTLTLPILLTNILDKTFTLAALLQTGILVTHVLRSLMDKYRQKKLERNAEAVTTLSSVTFILRVVLWVSLLLVALDNFGVNVTTLIAGLGVGGIAVALSVQNILSDLFASFSIVLDKPFVIGDFIIVGEFMGTVEYIGLKTTRLRSLSGEQLIFSNADLLSSRIRNYKRMYERRVVFILRVIYQTPSEKLEVIPSITRNIIEKLKKIRFERAHFMEYGSYSLNFEVVYWIDTPDYLYYMDIQQIINLEILNHFKQHGIEFALPTQKIELSGEQRIETQAPQTTNHSYS
ncbi:mechanosensitive ion channel family protein [Desulfosediminicola flagellatus]|uniref:mechanosensitive ion channel family protein n=1 Tax=Desulfosediminicola flagellatus TaxID=2569541 RepID=UPI0010AC392A|nr:mechanosensitive ion channel family protein [Desulfosediminicola flagellatus]